MTNTTVLKREGLPSMEDLLIIKNIIFCDANGPPAEAGSLLAATTRYCYTNCKINASWGNLSMAVDLHHRKTISYKLQRRQIEGKENPYWRSARPEVVIHAIQILHSWHATADRTSQGICYADDITGCASGVIFLDFLSERESH